jgi:hypothetical protein
MSIKKFDRRIRPTMTKTILKHTPTPPLGIGMGPLAAQVSYTFQQSSFL